jgi:hypothetical protein
MSDAPAGVTIVAEDPPADPPADPAAIAIAAAPERTPISLLFDAVPTPVTKANMTEALAESGQVVVQVSIPAAVAAHFSTHAAGSTAEASTAPPPAAAGFSSSFLERWRRSVRNAQHAAGAAATDDISFLLSVPCSAPIDEVVRRALVRWLLLRERGGLPATVASASCYADQFVDENLAPVMFDGVDEADMSLSAAFSDDLSSDVYSSQVSCAGGDAVAPSDAAARHAATSSATYLFSDLELELCGPNGETVDTCRRYKQPSSRSKGGSAMPSEACFFLVTPVNGIDELPPPLARQKNPFEQQMLRRRSTVGGIRRTVDQRPHHLAQKSILSLLKRSPAVAPPFALRLQLPTSTAMLRECIAAAQRRRQQTEAAEFADRLLFLTPYAALIAEDAERRTRWILHQADQRHELHVAFVTERAAVQRRLAVAAESTARSPIGAAWLSGVLGPLVAGREHVQLFAIHDAATAVVHAAEARRRAALAVHHRNTTTFLATRDRDAQRFAELQRAAAELLSTASHAMLHALHDHWAAHLTARN